MNNVEALKRIGFVLPESNPGSCIPRVIHVLGVLGFRERAIPRRHVGVGLYETNVHLVAAHVACDIWGLVPYEESTASVIIARAIVALAEGINSPSPQSAYQEAKRIAEGAATSPSEPTRHAVPASDRSFDLFGSSDPTDRQELSTWLD